MPAVYVISKNGKRLMPTVRFGRVRHLLKDGKAIIHSRHPFTIQLTYDSPENIQPMEIGVDAGYQHIGISVKSTKREYLSAEFKLLVDEKSRHDDCRKLRRTRRNRLRYRKPRWNNRTHSKPEGWLSPSIQHKADAHIDIIKRICIVAPVKSVTIEVGQFDPALLKVMQTGEKPPEGIEYQQGPLYFADSLRAAVFQRDNYTCKICKKSALKDRTIILHTHHALFWKGRHADTLNELITVCSNCHTSANHQPGGKLWGIEPKVARLEGATYMNIVRWYIIKTLRQMLKEVEVNVTYGSVTSRKRKDLGLAKSHAIDAYCIGDLQPDILAETIYYTKKRRNNRILEKFYDAKYYDSRDGKIRSGSELGCNRTNRKESRNSDKNLRMYHGARKSAGRRQIRRQRYVYQPNDVVKYNGKMYLVKGVQNLGAYTALKDFKPVRTSKLQPIKHVNGWYIE